MNVIDIQKLENVKPQSGYILAGCPACMEENGDSKKCHLSVLDDGRFNCIKYTKDKIHNQRILELVGTEVDNIPIRIIQPKIVTNQIWSPEILKRLIKDHSYWNARGISNEIIEPFGGGMASDGKLSNRYVFPCYNDKGEIVMFSGRTIGNSIPKWKKIGSQSNVFLFPHFAYNDIIKSKKIIILESIGDCLNLRKYNINIGIVIFGLYPSSRLMRFLIETDPNHIIISTNNDELKNNAGNKASEEIKNRLLRFFSESKIEIILPKSKDWGMAKEDEILEFKNKIEKLDGK